MHALGQGLAWLASQPKSDWGAAARQAVLDSATWQFKCALKLSSDVIVWLYCGPEETLRIESAAPYDLQPSYHSEMA